MAASSCNEDLCLPGVYIFPITLEQSQLSTGCYLKTNNYRCSYPCLAGTLTVGPKQRSSRVQQLVQQQELAASPSCCPPALQQPCLLAGCSLMLLPAVHRWMCSQHGAEHGRKPGDIKVWSAVSEAVPASPQSLPKVLISVAADAEVWWTVFSKQQEPGIFPSPSWRGLAQKPKAVVQFLWRERNDCCWI